MEAELVADLFWLMVVGGAAVWLLVLGLAYYVVATSPRPGSERVGIHLIVWGGCVFPTVVVTALVVWSLGLMPELRRAADGPTIAVSGERFWWRIAYDVEGGPGVVRNLPEGGVPSANELWLPLGRRTEILLGSPDVIHSLWIPAIAGKMDAIPGRVTRLVVEPTRPGTDGGACAEFCGDTHAQMQLRAVVVPEDEFAAYVEAQAAPAAITDGLGFELFMRHGCAACHTVRGTPADGIVGPDLTHLDGCATIAAGVVSATKANIAAFIRSPDHVKPGVEMPAFGMLQEDEIASIAQWLENLE